MFIDAWVMKNFVLLGWGVELLRLEFLSKILYGKIYFKNEYFVLPKH